MSVLRKPLPASATADFRALYRELLAAYGPRGWWPLPAHAGRPGFDALGYHARDYSTPRTPMDRFEVILGAVLTQNTAWTNASSALRKLAQKRVRRPADVLALRLRDVARLIRSSGYFNQKAKTLKGIARFFSARGTLSGARVPSRDALLALRGIGPETADSILLYAFHVPAFVVDAYTRRILGRVGLIEGKETYEDIQGMFHSLLDPDVPLFNEYHALFVEHAKAHCQSTPACEGCPVKRCHFRERLRAASEDAERQERLESSRTSRI